MALSATYLAILLLVIGNFAASLSEVAVKLLDDSNGRVVRDRIFTTVVPMSGDGAESAAIGLNEAAQRLASDVVAWTLTVI